MTDLDDLMSAQQEANKLLALAQDSLMECQRIYYDDPTKPRLEKMRMAIDAVNEAKERKEEADAEFKEAFEGERLMEELI